MITECYRIHVHASRINSMSFLTEIYVILSNSNLIRGSFPSYIQDTPHKIIPSQVLTAVKNIAIAKYRFLTCVLNMYINFYIETLLYIIIFFSSSIFQNTCKQGKLYGTPCTCLGLVVEKNNFQ